MISLRTGCKKAALSTFNQFLMVLMKLRLNITLQDLGYRFGIRQFTVFGLILCIGV